MRTLLLDHAERATFCNPKQKPTSRPQPPSPNQSQPKLTATRPDEDTMMLMKLMPKL